MKALARMVSVAIDPEFADAHEDYPTRLTVTLRDGRTLEQLRVYASGTRQYPMSPAQIEDKFLDCAAQALAPDAAKQILGDVAHARRAGKLRRILAAAAPGVSEQSESNRRPRDVARPAFVCSISRGGTSQQS